MTAAAFAVRLAARHTCETISIHTDGRVLHHIGITYTQILVDDVAAERGGRHAVDLEQAQLILVDTHLCNGVVNHHSQLGMEPDLKGFTAHGLA